MTNSNLKEKVYDFLGTGPTKKVSNARSKKDMSICNLRCNIANCSFVYLYYTFTPVSKFSP